MKARIERSCAALLLPLALPVSGCSSDREPCFGLRLAEPLQVHIVDEYSVTAGYDFNLGHERLTPSCPATMRLEPGSSLDVRVSEQQEDRRQSCRPNTVEVTAGSGLELGAQAPWITFGSEDIGEILHATHAVTLEGCPGSWGFSVETRSASQGEDGDAFLPAPSSGFPPVIMHLGFEVGDRESTACLQLLEGKFSCTDYYVVELSRP